VLILDRRQALAIPPLLRLGFRPFFLAGAALALVAVPLWLAALSGWLGAWQPAGGWLAWHRHELLFGFGLAIVAGFLLTAVQTWTGRPGLSGKPLALLAGLWLAARLAWLADLPAAVLIPLELGFPLLLVAVMARMLWAVRQKRNYPIVGVLTLLTLADALVLAGLVNGDDGWQRQGVLAGLWLVAALMGLIGGRVIPFFTQRGLGRVDAVQPWGWLDIALLLGTLLIAVLHAAGPALQAEPGMAVLFGALSVGHLLRLARWHDRGLWRVPLLWSLHLAYAWLIVATAGMALWHLGLLSSLSQPLHALTVGSMSGLILAMLARVTLGHTGRPLQLPGGVAAAFVLLNLGTLARVWLVSYWPLPALWLAAVCWALAFALYLWRYAPMLWSARVDGHPG
jgi:uncharacterized protein involved in response to NO